MSSLDSVKGARLQPLVNALSDLLSQYTRADVEWVLEALDEDAHEGSTGSTERGDEP